MAKNKNVAKRSVELKEVKLDEIGGKLVFTSEDLIEPIDFNSVVKQFVGCVVDFSMIENIVILSNEELKPANE